MNKYHQGVLLKEAISALKVEKGKKYIDATAGGGGHTEEILKRGGIVLALDRDEEAIEHIKKKFQIGEDLVLVNANFNKISQIARSNGFTKVDGILFDLGVSSHQFETPQRGFSFQKDGPLDMRMDTLSNITAYDLINNLEKRRLDEIFKKYGQEKFSLAIADAICSARKIKAITTTTDLANIVWEVYRKKRLKTKLHPATKVFQALRIVVNSELINLEEALGQTVQMLEIGGRLVVISFHSLEDKIVKRFLKENGRLIALSKLPIGPSSFEVLNNPRSRSAKMRIAQKT